MELDSNIIFLSIALFKHILFLHLLLVEQIIRLHQSLNRL